MNFSKDSWHFNFAHRWGGLTFWEDEPVRTSLCEYVKKVALGIFLFCLLTFVCASFTIGNGVGFYILATEGSAAWVNSAGFFVCNLFLFIFVALFATVYALSWYQGINDRRTAKAWALYREANPDAHYHSWFEQQYQSKKKTPSLIGEWIKAKKEKVCPIITVE